MKRHLIEEDVRIANTHRMRPPRSLASRETETKTTRRYRHTPLGTAKTTRHHQMPTRTWRSRAAHVVGQKMVPSLQESAWPSLAELNPCSLCHPPSDCVLGYLSQRNENLRSRESLYGNERSWRFTMAPNWEQPKCPSKGEQGQCIHTTDFSAMKRNELWTHTTWTNIQRIMLSEKSQSPKVTHHYDSIYIKVLK